MSKGSKMCNKGKWDQIAEQCKGCTNLRCLSANMDGNNTYYCGKYPLKDSNEICPKLMPEAEVV
jgi:hypothetical protein